MEVKCEHFFKYYFDYAHNYSRLDPFDRKLLGLSRWKIGSALMMHQIFYDQILVPFINFHPEGRQSGPRKMHKVRAFRVVEFTGSSVGIELSRVGLR